MNIENKSFFGVMKSYNKSFWLASTMELFERWAWYGLFAVLALYLTGSTDEGGLGFTHTEMATRTIEMPEITQEFTKNDYFNLASEKMGMTQVEMTQFIWDTYNPNKIWYVIVGIGIVTILALSIYDRLVIRPKEAKAA